MADLSLAPMTLMVSCLIALNLTLVVALLWPMGTMSMFTKMCSPMPLAASALARLRNTQPHAPPILA